MIVYTLKRLALAFLVAVTVSMVSFMLIRASGDPAIALAGEAASAEQIQHIREHYGFNRPLWCSTWIGVGAPCRAISASPPTSACP